MTWPVAGRDDSSYATVSVEASTGRMRPILMTLTTSTAGLVKFL